MKFIENLLLKQFAYKYRFFKDKHPELNEAELCDLVLFERIKKYPSIFLLRDNANHRVRELIDESFPNEEKNLFNVCEWFMVQQYKKYNMIHNSTDLTGWKERTKDLADRIKKTIKNTPGI